LCGTCTATRSIEYDHPDSFFKLANATAQLRWPNQKRFGRPPETSVICGRYGISEMHEIHGRR
jgi:hypothetical protein